MGKFIIGFCVFCVVLFLYLHIQFHLKVSDDLEIYEIEQVSKEKFEEICDLRQPVLFDFNNEKIVENTSQEYISKHYHAFEVKVINNKDTNKDSELFMPLSLQATNKLLEEDKESIYYSENNNDFLVETGVIKSMQYNDTFLRPPMVSNCNYDIMFGSDNTTTPLKYQLNYRNFFLVTQGSVHIKMAPPKSTKYLYPEYDYDNFEFTSPVNVWNVQHEYSADFDKIKCLEFTLNKGQTLFIPAYWWYSIKFEKKSSISCFYYKTYMNNVSILPYYLMYVLQIQNVKRDMVKKAVISSPLEKQEVKEEYKKDVIPSTTQLQPLENKIPPEPEPIQGNVGAFI